ncbi:selection and upkeep of intraepithelial T-cells protein 1-like [Seriola aureovittata]|uniref:selection and upkeep of intraepithelial T-cells protein 1-like n=1 Tax=Seriola aureovittata TaxID=2871759 RepID=UPI0024BE5635|nr:selection and upkeep of intraepithelial T-cells protein 1-like [Seriola aureovittata]
MAAVFRLPDTHFNLFLTSGLSVCSSHGVVFLVAALLSSCAGETSDNVPVRIRAYAGDTVILPCQIPVRGDIPTVEWTKEGPTLDIAFLYRQGCETFEMKNPVFQYRTNLFMNEVKNGNISLRFSDLQLSDAGTYKCKTLQGKNQKVVTTVALLVGAASEGPSVVEGVGDGVTLQCESSCWSPDPEITFHDNKGNYIDAENQQKGQDSRRCFQTRKVTLPIDTKSVTCRVHQPQTDQTRETRIPIPATSSCSMAWAAVVVAVILSVLISCVSAPHLRKKCGSCGEKGTGRNAEVNDPGNQADNTENTVAEYLRKIQELESNLRDKEEYINQLTAERKDLGSKPMIDNDPSKSSLDISNPSDLHPHQFPHGNSSNPAAYNNHPKSDNLPQKKDSKPAVSRPSPPFFLPANRLGSNNSSNPASTSEEQFLARSKSLSESRLHPKGGKLQRRYTISPSHQTRFLSDVPEDSLPLVNIDNGN